MAEIKLPVQLMEEHPGIVFGANFAVVADCGTRERAERVATALNEAPTLRARAEAAEAQVARVRELGEHWQCLGILRSVDATVQSRCGQSVLAALDGDGGPS